MKPKRQFKVCGQCFCVETFDMCSNCGARCYTLYNIDRRLKECKDLVAYRNLTAMRAALKLEESKHLLAIDNS